MGWNDRIEPERLEEVGRTIVAERTEVARARIPWGGALWDISDAKSPEEAAEISGMNFELGAVNLEHLTGKPELKNYKAIRNEDTGEFLGPIVGKDFGIMQWQATYDNVWEQVSQGYIKPDCAGTVNNGTRGIFQFSIPSLDFTIERHGRDNRVFEAKRCIRTGVDGVTAYWDSVLTQDLVCTNQFPGLKANGLMNYRRHTRNAAQIIARLEDRKFSDLKQMEYQRLFFTQLEHLEISLMTASNYFSAFLLKATDVLHSLEEKRTALYNSKKPRAASTRARYERKLDLLESLFLDGTGNDGQTGLDCLSAITEYLDFGYGSKAEEEELAQLIQARRRRTVVDGMMREARELMASTTDHQRKRANRNGFGSGDDEKRRFSKLLGEGTNIALNHPTIRKIWSSRGRN